MTHKTTKVEFTDHPVVSGYVEVKIPFYQERLRILKELDYQIGAEGKLEASSGDVFERMAKTVEVVQRFVSSVSLTVKEGGQQITSLDEVLSYDELQDLISPISLVIIRGLKLGKS